MTIAEFFVSLGIKGSEKTVGALKEVKGAMGDLKALSFEAKAAIAGVVYGLQHLMSQSAQTGTNLVNFSAYTGLSTKDLQQWGYAANQAGLDADEMAGAVKTLQQKMNDVRAGKAPEGFAIFANSVGLDMRRLDDTFYVMDQLTNKFSKLQGIPEFLRNSTMKGLGLSEGMIAAGKRGMFTPDKLAKAPYYGEGEIKALDNVNIAWKNLGTTIERSLGHFTAANGMDIVKVLRDVATVTIEIATNIAQLSKEFKSFGVIAKGIGIALAAYFAPIATTVTGLMLLLSEIQKYRKGKDEGNTLIGPKSTVGKAYKGGSDYFYKWFDKAVESMGIEANNPAANRQKMYEWWQNQVTPNAARGDSAAVGSVSSLPPVVNINNYWAPGDSQNVQKAEDGMRRSIIQTWPASPARKQGN